WPSVRLAGRYRQGQGGLSGFPNSVERRRPRHPNPGASQGGVCEAAVARLSPNSLQPVQPDSREEKERGSHLRAKVAVCDKRADSGYKESMNEALSRRLSQAQFADPLQEALLSLLVAANTLN